MSRGDNSLSTRQLFLYFGIMSLLVGLGNITTLGRTGDVAPEPAILVC